MKKDTQKLMHPVGFKVKARKPRRKLQIHDFIYILLCILIIIGFSDNVERFIKSQITPRVVIAQTRVNNAKNALMGEIHLIQPVSAAYPIPTPIEVKNPFDPRSPKGIGWERNKQLFGVEHWGALEELITNESGWNPYAANPNGGACGIGQALPCSKMDCEQWDYSCQVDWTLNYIKNRYENPTKAWEHWNAEVEIDGQNVGHWY